MARRFQPRTTAADNLRTILRTTPVKLFLLLPLLFLVIVPTFVIGTGVGKGVFPSLTEFFYTVAAPPPAATPTPQPPFPGVLPQIGSILYTVQGGDNCVSILAFEMRMANAGQIFSDVKPETVKALNASLGQDCHKLQPGMVLPLSPHYPLMALGGVVRKIDATSPQKVIPTPLISVPRQEQTIDCSDGCLLTVQLTPSVKVRLTVETTLNVRIGSWVWALATMERKPIKNFDTYPYVDPHASLDGMRMRACDLQVDDAREAHGISCDDLEPNTIDADGGAWLVGVTGRGALDHWRYPLHLPSNTRVLMWLSESRGKLTFQRGNPLYRYDENTHLYVKV
jgi:hypothetical protein